MSVPTSALDEVLSLLVGDSIKTKYGDGDDDESGRARHLQRLLCSDNQDPLLDSALAMLGFTNAEVQRSFNKISGRTLITVLSSSISCGSKSCFNQSENASPSNNAFMTSCFMGDTRSQREEFLGSEHSCCGGPFSLTTIKRIMEESLSFVKGTELEESIILELLEVLVKVFSMTSMFKSKFAGPCLLFEREEQQQEASTIIDPLIQFSLGKKEKLKGLLFAGHRLLLWRLQPELLVQDLSALLQTMAERPLMSLKNEFRHRKGWYNLIIAMASGPDAFMEGRQTLNAWLLVSGAPFIWELKIELGATIRDVLEHPSSWGLSVEVGVSLPPVSTFYHDRLHSLAVILTRPPSWAGLRELVSFLEDKASQNTGYFLEDANQLDENSRKTQESKTATTCQNLALEDSLWMLLMDFPAWLQFASLSLFQRPVGSSEGHANSGSIGSEDQYGLEHLRWLRHQEAAARYIAWHFSPQDQKLRDLVVRMLMEMVESWLSIKDEKGHLREDEEVPSVKRRKLMFRENMIPCNEQKVVKGEISEIKSTQSRVGKDAFGHTDSFEGSTQAVQNWLLNFQECCCFLDSYTKGGPCHFTASTSKHQAKRRLLMAEAIGDCTRATEQDPGQPVATSSQCKSYSFFDTFPLVALLCSPLLHTDAVIHLVLHFVMVGTGFSSMKKDVGGVADVFTSDNCSFTYQEGRKGLACREPSHRTEDFRDICQAPFCLNFSLQESSFSAIGAARVFRFLESLDLLEASSFLNGWDGIGWLSGFKETVARQLQMCIKSWFQQGVKDNTRLTVLDDLQRRAALWAVKTGLESKTLNDFNKVIQGLDILIASTIVEDTLVDT